MRKRSFCSGGFVYKKRYIFQNLKWVLNEVRYGCQRFWYGYSDKDVWNVDMWFLDTCPSLLRELRDTTHGYPSRAAFEEIKDSDCWTLALSEMADHLERAADIDGDLGVFPSYKSKSDYLNYHKNKGLEMFSRYLYDLWD